MNKKRIYFVQAGFAFDKSVYLPYATGCLAAYALQFEDFKDVYEVMPFIFKRERIDDIVNKISNPYMVAFSNYTWNTEFNKALARKIKEKYSECKILFGGHSVPNDKTDLLEEFNFIDYLIFGEGEEPFYNLLMTLENGGNIFDVSNIAFRDENGKNLCTKRTGDFDISVYPSPYTTGLFDSIVKTEKEELLSVIETNRSCPYKCAYCDWSAKSKVRFFPMDKIKAELDWLSKNKIEYCFCADANFGMFKRDVEVAEYAIKLKNKTGYPDVFRPCYAKESDDIVFKICSEFNKCHMDKGATMAYQTLCEKALENINRKNLTMDHFADIVAKYNHEKIPTYSELILGLPGETYDSFCDGLCKLLEAGQHNSVSVYHCEVLPNSIMGQDSFIEKFKIKSQKVKFNHIHSAENNDEVEEYSQIVMGTYSMSKEMWVKSNLFSVCLQCFHSLGLMRCFAVYAHYEKKISYREYYDRLLKYLLEHPETTAGKIIADYSDKLSHSLDGDWNYYNPEFGNIVWFFEEGMFLECMYNSDKFVEEMKPFIDSLELGEDMKCELTNYQQSVLRRPKVEKSCVISKYDFIDYFENIYSGEYKPLEKRYTKVLFEETSVCDDWYTFAKSVVWFGRRKGATLYTSDAQMYKVERQ